MKRKQKFATQAIHIGQEPEKTYGSVIPPIYMTVNYKQDYPGELPGGVYDYTRAYNPNFTNVEATLAVLEQAKYATFFSSGLGATTALLSTLNKGDHVLLIDDLYGGTYRLFDKLFQKYGVTFTTVDMQDLKKVETSFKKNTKLVFLETPTNPFLKIIDIEAIAKLAKKHKALTVVDNTFSPYLQHPLHLGADVVVYSTTKYISGHSDVVGGAVISNDENLRDLMEYHRKVIGVNSSPFDAWLVSRSLKTLVVRMERHCENAQKIAQFLEKHPRVKKVYFPGLETHKNHAVAKKQMSGYGGMVSVEFNLSFEKMVKFIRSLKLFILAESLGAVESLVDHPASMTHMGIPKEVREQLGLHDGLVRFSIGLEDPDDLIEDLNQAFNKL